MISADVRTGLLLVLGIGLLLNPVYFAPGNLTGEESTVTYEVEQIQNESDSGLYIGRSDRVLQCGTERACVLEEQIADQGEISYNGSVQERDYDYQGTSYQTKWSRYDLVQMNSTFYASEITYEDDMTILSHDELTTEEALEHVAVSSNHASSGVAEAVESGSVTVYDRQIVEFERNDIIEHNGQFYRQSARYGTSSSDEIFLTRLGLFLAGTVAIFIAWGWRGQQAQSS